MDNELWVILLPIVLLPVFFAMGWFAARVDMKTVLKQAKSIPAGFYKSLDALVDRNSGRAARELAGVIDQHIFGVLHVFLVDIVTHPEAALEVLDPHAGDAAVRTGGTGEALVLRLFTEARRDIAANVNARMVFFDTALRLIVLLIR